MLCSRLLEVVAPFFFYSCGDHRDRHSFPTHALPIFFAANGLAIFLNDSGEPERARELHEETLDRKSTRPNSSHVEISYAVFCLKKKKLPTIDNAARQPVGVALQALCQRQIVCLARIL